MPPKYKIARTEQYIRDYRRLSPREKETARNLEEQIANYPERQLYLRADENGKPIWAMFGMYLYTAFQIGTGPVAVLLAIGHWLPRTEDGGDEEE